MNDLGESARLVSVHVPMHILSDHPMNVADTPGGGIKTENDWKDKEDAEDLAEDVSHAFHDILHIAEDLVDVFPCTAKD